MRRRASSSPLSAESPRPRPRSTDRPLDRHPGETPRKQSVPTLGQQANIRTLNEQGEEMARTTVHDVAASPSSDAQQRATQRRALLASSVGTFIEFYDFAIYGYTAVVIAAMFFPEGDPFVALLSALAVYGIAFVMRPLGGIFFGRLGDRIGR